jgi:PTH1 family peptidyl-tRNA hydrolase
MIFWFVGLGNPGREYEMTRHNIGFMVLKAFALELGVQFQKASGFACMRAKTQVDGAQIELILPTTFMNDSGVVVAALCRYFGWDVKNILVVADDMHLGFGQMRLRQFGGTGGHNGLKSIERSLGTNEYARLKVGIGNAPSSHVEHVLSNFTEQEQLALREIIQRAVGFLKRLVKEEFTRVAMDANKVYNFEERNENTTTNNAV